MDKTNDIINMDEATSYRQPLAAYNYNDRRFHTLPDSKPPALNERLEIMGYGSSVSPRVANDPCMNSSFRKNESLPTCKLADVVKVVEHVVIPKIYHPFIIGPFNGNLNKLIDETGTKINVPQQTVYKDEITITGEKDAVFMAKNKIEDIFKEMEKKCSTVNAEIPKSQHIYIIGPHGSGIQEILQTTGVSVEIPPTDGNSDTITLRGPQMSLVNALSMVYQKACSVESLVIDTPTWIHKYITDKNNAKMKKFEQDYPNVNVYCLNGEIKLEGDLENVKKAKSYLQAVIDDYKTNYTYVTLTVNPSHYKHIIGNAGANIKHLQHNFRVMMNIEEKKGQNIIHIEGPNEDVLQAQLELQGKIDKLENEKMKDVIIKRHHHRSLIGPKGEKIRDLQNRYQQVQITFPLPSKNSDFVKIRGPQEEVDKTAKDLLEIVKEVEESSFSAEVAIFKPFHKFIIGKDGANIKKIRNETQTKIDLPAEDERNETIVITGKKENVEKARERIQMIQNELADIITEEVQISPKYFNLIIGAGGKRISPIMEECGGVLIKFPSSDSDSDKVTIRGSKDNVEKAKVRLLELANELQATSFTAEVYAQQQHHKLLIGKNGASIQKIRDRTGARIIFPESNDDNKEVITIIGYEENVKAAKEQLEAIIKDFDNVTDDEILIDPKYHKHFVSKRCEIIHQLEKECGGVSISFPRARVESDRVESDRVTLKGAKDCIEAAKQRISEIVSDLEAQVIIECVIPQRHHRTIMGSRGVNVQDVSGEFDVQIKFPDREATEEVEGMVNGTDEVVRQCDIIRITGRKEKADPAKQALIDLIPITEEINVPFDLHRSIIGQKGSNIREFMGRYKVHIELSPPEMKLDVIKITGTPSKVAEAKEALFDKVKDLEADRKDRELRSFEIKIDIDPEYHPKIIGRRGFGINQIRTDFNVNVSFPRREDQDDSRTITIQGYEANAQAARDKIMKIVNDLNELVREVIEIDQRIHKRLIGQRGRNIRKIMEDCKVDIKFPKQGDENLNAVTITGSEEAVQEAKDHILKLEQEYKKFQNESEDMVTDQVKIPHKYFSSIIGAGGRVISSIREECGGVFIKFPSSQSKSDMVTIRGFEDDVEKAKMRIFEMVSECQSKSFTAEVYAKQRYHKILIGINGSSIQKIREETGAQFVFPGLNDEKRDVITIIGKEANVKAAQEQLETEINKLTEEEIIINPDNLENFILKRHKVIRSLQNEFDHVSLSYPRFDDDGTERVILICTKEHIQAAKDRFYELISQVTIDCVIPKNIHKSIKGSYCFKVRRICNEFNVKIEFPSRQASKEINGISDDDDTDEVIKECDIIHITGTKENAEAAKEALINSIPITEEINIRFNLHRLIFGKESSQHQEFMRTYNVKIKLPSPKKQLDTIKIIGPASKIAEAKKAIYDKLPEVEAFQADLELRSFEIKLDIDPKYYHKIRNSADIQKIRTEFNVKVSFQKKKRKCDKHTITIQGYEANANAIRDEIIKIVDELKNRVSVHRVIEVPKRIIKHLVSQYNNRMQKRYDINIKSLNPDQENSNTIIVTGNEEDVTRVIEHMHITFGKTISVK